MGMMSGVPGPANFHGTVWSVDEETLLIRLENAGIPFHC